LKGNQIYWNKCQLWILVWLLVVGATGVTQKATAQEYTLPKAEESIDSNLTVDYSLSENNEPMAQVTSVSQLKDIQSTDWAFQALQSLVERYGCIVGFPDATYRGNRSISRYEFAAGVNACLERINELIITSTNDLVTREDLGKLRKLQEEFASELVSLRGRVDSLEARTTEIATQQFSPTTKLSGLLIAGIQGRSSNRGDVNPRDGIKDSDDAGTNTNVISLAQLFLTTQFTPRSYLLTGLLFGVGSSGPRFSNNVSRNNVIVGYEYPTNDELIVSDLNYHWLVTDNLAVMLGTQGVNMTTAFRGPNRVENAATGPLSFFAQRNPILNMGFGHGGIAVDWQFAKRASLQALYSSFIPGNPGKKTGLFDGNTTTGIQLLLTPTDAVDLSLYYVNNYSSDGCLLTYVQDECLTANSEPLKTNAVGATVTWQISPRFNIGAWGGYTNSYIPGSSGNVETNNYMVFMNFPDLFSQGNLGGIYIGQPPKITSSGLPDGSNVPDSINTGRGRAGGQPGTTTHIEVFYRFQLNDNISITPGIIHILQPGHTPDNDPVTIGILRSTFSF
jgi:BMFP domain-containing protein YqiC